MKWYDLSEKNIDVYGMNRSLERLPESVAETVSDEVAAAYNMPAGGRLRFSTNSKTIAVKANVTEHKNVGFDLYRVFDNSEVFSAGFRNALCFICNGEFEAANTVADGKNIESYTFGKSY